MHLGEIGLGVDAVLAHQPGERRAVLRQYCARSALAAAGVDPERAHDDRRSSAPRSGRRAGSPADRACCRGRRPRSRHGRNARACAALYSAAARSATGSASLSILAPAAALVSTAPCPPPPPQQGRLQPRPRSDRPGRVPPRRPPGRGGARRPLRRLAHARSARRCSGSRPRPSSPATAAASSSPASTTTSSASSTWCAPSSRASPPASPPSTPAPEEIRVLWEMVARDRELVGDPEALARANKRFHHQLHLASHNRYLIQQLEMVRRSMALVATTSLAAAGRAARALDEHEAIVRAIEARDGAAAEEVDPRPHQQRPRDPAPRRRRPARLSRYRSARPARLRRGSPRARSCASSSAG